MSRGFNPITLFAKYSLHVWALLLLTNFGLYEAWRFFIRAQECLTPEQVAGDSSRCLFIYSGSVYQIGQPGSGHMGHECGSDVTAVMRGSHVADMAYYLDPRRVASVCADVPQPTLTPTPTNPPEPTSTPVPPPPVETPVPPTPTSDSSVPQPTATQEPASGGGMAASPTPTSPAATPTKKASSQTFQSAGTLQTSPTMTPTIETAEEAPSLDVATVGMVVPRLESADEADYSVQPVIPPVWEKTVASVTAVFVERQYLTVGWWIRFLGIVAFLLFGVSIVVGFSRVFLFRFAGRRLVMWTHYLTGAAGAAAMAGHILLVLFDKNGWGASLSWVDLVVPHFSTRPQVTRSLGIAGWVLTAVVIGSGILFKRLSRWFGYRAWHGLHLLSLVMVLLVFAHAYRVGTDFTHPYIMGGFWLLVIYVLWKGNFALWQLFNAPRPVAQVHELAREPHLETVDRTYYVQPKIHDERGGWWVTLSDGVSSLWGYTPSDVVQEAWWKVRGRELEARGVPMVRIEAFLAI